MVGRLKSESECNPNLFLGTAISGGGSRAANFGVGALWELQQLGILDHPTALSSVSGGSLAATYVALNGLDSRTKFDAATEVILVARRSDGNERWSAYRHCGVSKRTRWTTEVPRQA